MRPGCQRRQAVVVSVKDRVSALKEGEWQIPVPRGIMDGCASGGFDKTAKEG